MCFRTARRRVRHVFRRKDACHAVLYAGGSSRLQKHKVFRMGGEKDSFGVRHFAQSGFCAGAYHVRGLHDTCQRHGAHHLSAPRLRGFGQLRQTGQAAHSFRHAKRSRQPRRHAYSLRKPSEPVSVLLLRTANGGVYAGDGGALRRSVGVDLGGVRIREGGRRFPRGAAGRNALCVALRPVCRAVRAVAAYCVQRAAVVRVHRRRRDCVADFRRQKPA